MITDNTNKKEPNYNIYIAGIDPIQVSGIQSSLGELYIYKGDSTPATGKLTHGTVNCTAYLEGTTVTNCIN